MTIRPQRPGETWRISTFLAHCLFVILYQLKEQGGENEEGPNFAIWYAAFAPFEASFSGSDREERNYTGLIICPADSDREFFKRIVENELARLRALHPNAHLYCEHRVHEHSDALTEWLRRSIETDSKNPH